MRASSCSLVTIGTSLLGITSSTSQAPDRRSCARNGSISRGPRHLKAYGSQIYIADYDPKWPGMFEAEAQCSVLRLGDWLFASTTLDPPRSPARGEAGDRRADRCCGSAARRVIWSAAQVTRLHVHDCAGFLFPPTCRVAPHTSGTCARGRRR